jgi:SAM-dependent methyltransferase
VSEALPTATHRIFQHARVAAGYASARPYLHPQVFARVREMIGAESRLGRALDVGCGTGLSSFALLDVAESVVGIDASLDMLRHAIHADAVTYAASGAETPPFRAGSFDLVAACGSMDWIDREHFLPRAADLVVAGGWLVSLDFGDTGRSPEVPGLARWYDEVLPRRYPRPPAKDPMIAAAEAERHGFRAPVHRDLSMACPFTAAGYAAFLMTESNVIAAVEYGGETADAARTWLEAELAPLFGTAEHVVTFGGYVQAMRRL